MLRCRIINMKNIVPFKLFIISLFRVLWCRPIITILCGFSVWIWLYRLYRLALLGIPHRRKSWCSWRRYTLRRHEDLLKLRAKFLPRREHELKSTFQKNGNQLFQRSLNESCWSAWWICSRYQATYHNINSVSGSHMASRNKFPAF